MNQRINNRKFTKRKQALVSTACASALLLNSIGVFAQDKPRVQTTERQQTLTVVPAGDGTATFSVRVPEGGGAGNWETRTGQRFSFTQSGGGVVVGGAQGNGANTMSFIASDASFDGRIVQGAPYSAESISEFTQVLGDGNRITRRTASMIYRDGQGRTRREQNPPIGMIENNLALSLPATTIINDPVEGYTYVLNEKDRSARRSRAAMGRTLTRGSAGGNGTNNTVSFVATDGSLLTGTVSDTSTGAAAATATTAPRQIRVSGGVLQGSATSRVQPVYPPAAKAAKVSGQVQVQVTINEKGEVADAQVISGPPLLREAALEAARQWQFKAIELSGAPVKVQGTLTFNFSLADDQTTTNSSGTLTLRSEGNGNSSGTVLLRSREAEGGAATRVNFKREQLGKQMIEGVECDGQRTIQTIPAGQIGNERAIEIINERWYSPELQVTVLSKQIDPRFGETVIRLAGIVRAEPDETLFRVPSDYTVKDENVGFRVMEVEEKLRRPEEDR